METKAAKLTGDPKPQTTNGASEIRIDLGRGDSSAGQSGRKSQSVVSANSTTEECRKKRTSSVSSTAGSSRDSLIRKKQQRNVGGGGSSNGKKKNPAKLPRQVSTESSQPISKRQRYNNAQSWWLLATQFYLFLEL